MNTIELNCTNGEQLFLTPQKDVDNNDLYNLIDGAGICWFKIKLLGREYEIISPKGNDVYNQLNLSEDELKERIAPLILEIFESEQSGFSSTEGEEEAIPTPYNPDDIKVSSKQFSIKLIKEMIDSDDLDLNPDFQRHFVWDRRRKSRLIESILLRIPLPMFYFSEDKEGKLTVIDGLQRITTINDFMDGKFSLKDLEYLKDSCEGKKYSTLESKYSRWFNLTQLSGNVIDPSSPYKVKYDIFRRINTGGKPLNNQEIRNCLASTALRTTLQKMVNSQEFKNATDNSIKSIRMGDEEIALRFILFRRLIREDKKLDNYNGYMDFSLDELTENMQKIQEEDSNKYVSEFSVAMKNAEYLFGRKYAFRKVQLEDIESNARKQPINKVLFVSWSVLLADYDTDIIKQKNNENSLLNPLATAIENNREFRNYLSSGTNGKANIQFTFSNAKKIITEHLQY
jgi:hypothetical protein